MDESCNSGYFLRKQSIYVYTKYQLNGTEIEQRIFPFQLLANIKADAIVKEVGYPEWLPDDDALDKYFENVITWFPILYK